MKTPDDSDTPCDRVSEWGCVRGRGHWGLCDDRGSHERERDAMSDISQRREGGDETLQRSRKTEGPWKPLLPSLPVTLMERPPCTEHVL